MRRRALAAATRAAARVVDTAGPTARPTHGSRLSWVRTTLSPTFSPTSPVCSRRGHGAARWFVSGSLHVSVSEPNSSVGTHGVGEVSHKSIITSALVSRLDATVDRRDALLQSLVADPPPPHWETTAINKELARVERVVAAYDGVRAVRDEIESLNAVLRDETSELELKSMAGDERSELVKTLPELEERLAVLLLPVDDTEDAGAIVEVRAGTGGDEAALFAAELLKMYELFAKKKGWRFEILTRSLQESGGFREASASFVTDGGSDAQSEKNVYSTLQYESGVHRVQRVPATETQGRVHTSTASVAVLPHLEELGGSDDLVKDEDVRVDTMRASGAGGQHVNTTNSAVRLTHIPTNTVVICQDERSQHKNKDKAFKVLRARVFEAKRLEAHNSRADLRKGLIGSGDRSERVRTYNFKEGRVKDHRVNHLVNDLTGFLEGGDALTEMLFVLATEDRKRKLEEFKE